MLSSPRLTGFDLMLAALFLLIVLRILSPDLSVPAQANADPLGEQAEVDALVRPLPSTADAARADGFTRLDLAMRCIALADLQEDTACRFDSSTACWQARRHAARIEYSLWPKGRPGQLAMAFRDQIGAYAHAYGRLAQQNNHTSELIRRRDDAMCKGYQARFGSPSRG